MKQKQKGFVIPFLPLLSSLSVTTWIIIGLSLALVAQHVLYRFARASATKWETAHKDFVAGTKAAGEARVKRTKQIAAASAALLKETENAYKIKIATLDKRVGELNGDVERLRNRNSGGRIVPAVPIGSNLSRAINPAVADGFDRALQEYHSEIRSRIGSSYAEIAGLIAEGARNAIDLQCGRDWIDRQRLIQRE